MVDFFAAIVASPPGRVNRSAQWAEKGRNVKVLCVFLAALCLLFPRGAAAGQKQKFSASFFGVFDTVTQLIGYADSEEAFQQAFEEARTLLTRYHQVYDGYNAYDGVFNLYYVNHHAASGPVKAEPELIGLLLWAREKQAALPPGVNIAMGAVLETWHRYREGGMEIPPLSLLTEQAAHTDIRDLVIDPENGTVYFADPLLRLDLGAVAKGYAAEMTAQRLKEIMSSFLLSVGGNIRAGEQPLDGRARWGAGIQHPGDGKGPAPNENLDVLYVKGQSVVTSGDYQRFYAVDGVRYHHIIDPQTLMPARFVRAVTVVTEDSGYADLLSTALFLMPYEEARAFADETDGVEAYWVLNDGTVRYTDGMKAMLRSEGASARD